MLYAIRNKPNLSAFGPNDTLVLVGELFQRGYANGLVEEAEKCGMKIIKGTVGRRDKDGVLRPLNAEEAALHGDKLINVPLEAGFDLEPADNEGNSPVDLLKNIKLSDWDKHKLDWQKISISKQLGEKRFKENLNLFLKSVTEQLKQSPKKSRVIFAHLMAGGVPRAKIVMPLMNRAFKGRGERYLSSEYFWKSDIGRLCSESFQAVTADTFSILVNHSSQIREMIQANGGTVSYLAYGYHGTEVLIDDKYQWQSYTPYLQGWAKLQLERYSQEFFKQGIQTCVYNCPEILTNSSSIFQGVEVYLYLLIDALNKECPNSPKVKELFTACEKLLKPGVKLQELPQRLHTYFADSEIKAHCIFEKWPQHSSEKQLSTMLNKSEEMFALHLDEKNLITSLLSDLVIESCGFTMLHDAFEPKSPVAWIGHDLVAKLLPN